MAMSKASFGWAGKVLKVDLSKREVVEEPLSDDFAFLFLGSRGFDAKFLWDMIKPGIDPLGPENVLSLGAGLLTGTIFPECGRVNVGCLSPLTGIYGYGNAGGYWASRLKAAGYDHVIITGRSEKPVYLLITDNIVEIKEAGDLWGKSTFQTVKILRERHGRDMRVCCIGQAGENLVRTACTIIDGFFAANGGSGAVWGSKNLKAIAATGSKKIKIADPQEFLKLAKKEAKRIIGNTGRPYAAEYKKYGTLYLYDLLTNYEGFGADRRFLSKEEMKNILAANLFERYCIGYHAGCSNCLENCTHLFEVFEGPYAGTRAVALRFGSTDYMTLGMGNSNAGSLVKFHNLVNQYGLCGKMMPSALSFALELYERGILTKTDTGGIEIKAGDHEAIMKLTHMTAFREGFGNILAEGPGNMARIIPGAFPYRHGVYGRTYKVALPFITATRGTDHLGGTLCVFYPPEYRTKIYEKLSEKITSLAPPTEPGVQGKGPWMVWEENSKAVYDSIGRCILPSGGYMGGNNMLAEIEDDPFGKERAKLLQALTGEKLSAEEILTCGERIFNLERAFNIRQGAGRSSDLPAEHEQHNDFDFLAYGKVTPDVMRAYLEDYYKARGWDIETGIPTKAKLKEMRLSDVAEELEADKPYKPWEGPPLWPLDKYPSGRKRK